MLKGATIRKLYHKTVFCLVNKNQIHANISVTPAEMVYLKSINPSCEEETAFENDVKCFQQCSFEL